MFVRAVIAAATVAIASMALIATPSCGAKPQPQITIEGRLLTVDNRTSQAWKDVEVWVNGYYRVTTPAILPDRRLQVPLDAFIAGFGQRFDFRHEQIKDVRLTARLPDGKPLEIRKPFEASGLAETLGAALGKKP